MAKRNDFLEGFLKGLYQSGVGNPEVQRANEASTAEQQAKLNAQFAEKGMLPGAAPQPSTLPAPTPAGAVSPGAQGIPLSNAGTTVPNPAFSPEHPVAQKIGSFISTLFGGSSKPLQTAFHKDPNSPNYYQKPTGETSFTMGANPIPAGSSPLDKDRGPALLASTAKTDRTNLGFDTARSMATLANKPKALEGVITEAQKQGRDYITKDEMATAMRAISTGATSERGDYYKGMLGVHRERLDLAKRQAAFGKAGYGSNQISLNTALQHTASVKDGLQAINNTDTELLNVPINQLKEHTNDPAILSLMAETTALADELASAFKGSSGTDIQMQEWAKFLKTSITPDQAAGLMPTIADLLDARLTNLERQQKLVAPSVVNQPITSPTAEKARDKIRSPLAAVKQINTQAEYDALPTGASYVDSHGTKSVKR